MIGRHGPLRGGLSRENAINLLTWLVIATKATDEEIAAELKEALKMPPVAPQRAPVVSLPPRVQATIEELKTYVGDLDSEEKASVDAVAQK